MPPPPTPTLVPSHPSQTAYFHTVLNTPPSAPPRPRNPSGAAASSSSSSVRNSPLGAGKKSGFTSAQRSAQARGKPYPRGGGGEEECGGGGGGGGGGEREGFEQRRARENALTVLENVEMLVWYSCARNESLSQTRQHFQNILLGLETSPMSSPFHSAAAAPYSSPTLYREEYEIPENQRVRFARDGGGGAADAAGDVNVAMGGMGTGSPRSAKGKERERERMKRFGGGVGVSV